MLRFGVPVHHEKLSQCQVCETSLPTEISHFLNNNLFRVLETVLGASLSHSACLRRVSADTATETHFFYSPSFRNCPRGPMPPPPHLESISGNCTRDINASSLGGGRKSCTIRMQGGVHCCLREAGARCPRRALTVAQRDASDNSRRPRNLKSPRCPECFKTAFAQQPTCLPNASEVDPCTTSKHDKEQSDIDGWRLHLETETAGVRQLQCSSRVSCYPWSQ